MIFILIVKNHGAYAYRTYQGVIGGIIGKVDYEIKVYTDDCSFVTQMSAAEFDTAYGPKTFEQRLTTIEQRLDALSNTQIKIG